ncbi:hypothetical protein UR09_03690 [Candidatus Nitromaritima sp. SCGC AAA799-A02]|nr:hypothetical protein UR09_03690 [Candidatus Nitromaritima sp. SCGC AAA799-A02]
MEDENKNKYDFLIHLLGEGDAMVCLDARHPGVDVPAMHKDNSALSLIFNLNFRRPIDILEEGIYATLAFGGRSHKCIIPFEAVWAIHEPETQKGQVWEGSFPKDLKLEVPGVGSDEKKPPAAKKTGPRPTRSRKAAPQKSNQPKKDRSHLRVIK